MTIGATAQVPYFTNLDSALRYAQKSDRMVILYTGSRELCPGHDPKAFFFGPVLGTHLPLGTRSNAYVVCEQFLVNAAHDARGEPSRAFLAEVMSFDALFKRYHLEVFSPAITILDAHGLILSGPYTYSGPDNTFGNTEFDSYELLQEYGESNPPIFPTQGRSNLLAAMAITNNLNHSIRILHTKYDKNRNQKEILLDSGVPSRAYELGKDISFTLRDCDANTFDFGGGRGETMIVAVGTLRPDEAFTGKMLVCLNGVYFRGNMNETGDHTGTAGSKVRFKSGEHYFTLDVSHKPTADRLLQSLEKLRPVSSPKK